MNKIIPIIILIIILIIAAQNNKNSQDISAAKATVTTTQTATHSDCPLIDNFFNDQMLQRIYSPEGISINDLESNPNFKNIKLISQKNDGCDYRATAVLYFIYFEKNHIHGIQKSKDYTSEKEKLLKKLFEFANSGNIAASDKLCRDDTGAISDNQRIMFCEKTINNYDKDINNDILWFGTAHTLIDLYEKYKAVDKIDDLCKNVDIKPSKVYCKLTLGEIADDFYKNKNYEQALNAYEKKSFYDDSGFTDYGVADMYLNGKGTSRKYDMAIYYYDIALNKLDESYTSTRAAALNNRGTSYSELKDYVQAVKSYESCAQMNNSLCQYNLAIMYAYGHGVILDQQKAFALADLAISVGLSDKKQEADAIQLRYNLGTSLYSLDRTGYSLTEARNLAKKYYKKYVLHDTTVVIPD